MKERASRVLLLDAGWIPFTVLSLAEAFILLHKGKVEPVWSADETEYYLHSIGDGITRKAWPVPHVMAITTSAGRNALSKISGRRLRPVSRRGLFERDGGCCQYCSKKLTIGTMTMDHVHPKSRGGENTWENLVTSCQRCNTTKGDRTPQEANMTLLSLPKKPSYFEGFLKQCPPEALTAWKAHLDHFLA